MSYSKIVEQIKTAPKTFLPALLITLVKMAYENNVFLPGGASRIIQKVEADLPLNKKVEDLCSYCHNPAILKFKNVSFCKDCAQKP